MEVQERKTNPYGANQHQLDPRQQLFWGFYVNPLSETFGNALQSALKVGYTQGTATQITTFDWFIEKCRRSRMKDKAEKVLEDMLEMPVEVLEKSKSGDEKFDVVITEPALVKIKQDTAKFVAERLGKDNWSQKSEVEQKNINVNISIDENRFKKIIGIYGNNRGRKTSNASEDL